MEKLVLQRLQQSQTIITKRTNFKKFETQVKV